MVHFLQENRTYAWHQNEETFKKLLETINNLIILKDNLFYFIFNLWKKKKKYLSIAEQLLFLKGGSIVSPYYVIIIHYTALTLALIAHRLTLHKGHVTI